MFEISDSEILPLSLEHSFWTWSAQGKVTPIPVKNAKGVYFWDVAGKRYLDFNSMVMCVNIGHGDERVIRPLLIRLASFLAGHQWLQAACSS
jgi:taurine--2-oxoglutarate transaminase